MMAVSMRKSAAVRILKQLLKPNWRVHECGDCRHLCRACKPLSFATFLRYGVPLTLCQLAVSALYVLVLFYALGR
jgi:hypothetical protein